MTPTARCVSQGVRWPGSPGGSFAQDAVAAIQFDKVLAACDPQPQSGGASPAWGPLALLRDSGAGSDSGLYQVLPPPLLRSGMVSLRPGIWLPSYSRGGQSDG